MGQMDSTGQKAIWVVANPRAGKLRRSPDWRTKLSRAVVGRGRVLTPWGLRELASCCVEIAQERPDTVVIAGGDGTVMQVLSSMRRIFRDERLPSVVVLPFGTVNTTVRHWVGPGEAWTLLDRFFAGEGAMLSRRTLHVELDGTVHVAATMGLGLVSHFFEEYERDARRGVVRASMIIAQVFYGSLLGSAYARRILGPTSVELSVNGQKSPLESLTLLVCSVFENVGLGLRPTYRAVSSPGRVHLVATDLEARYLGPQVWRVFLGQPLIAPRIVDEVVDNYSVEFAAADSIILDGDRLLASRVVVKAGDDLLIWNPRCQAVR